MKTVDQGWTVRDFLLNYETYAEAYKNAYTGQDSEINQFLVEQKNNYPQHAKAKTWQPLWDTLRNELIAQQP